MIDTLIKSLEKRMNPQTLKRARHATQIQIKERPRHFVMIAFDQQK